MLDLVGFLEVTVEFFTLCMDIPTSRPKTPTKRYTGSSKKNLAKFSDTCSVRADGLCIGSPRLVGGRKAGNSNMQEFFCTKL